MINLNPEKKSLHSDQKSLVLTLAYVENHEFLILIFLLFQTHRLVYFTIVMVEWYGMKWHGNCSFTSGEWLMVLAIYFHVC